MSDSQIRKQRDEDIEKSTAARPDILWGLRAGEELLSIAHKIAAEHHIDQQKAYKWVVITDEEFAKRRKIVGTLGLIVLWIGALTLVSGLIMLVVGYRFDGILGMTLWLNLVALGLVLMVPGAVFSLLAGKLIFRLRSRS